jgi:starch phosphorylase
LRSEDDTANTFDTGLFWRDLMAYLEADARLIGLYADPQASARKAILNVAASGKFSSDSGPVWIATPHTS